MYWGLKMYNSYFGIKSTPFSKENNALHQNDQVINFRDQFANLAISGGIGTLTGDSGSGKTSAVRYSVNQLNPQIYKIFYLSESHFTSYDVYRQIGNIMGITIPHRFADLWRNIKDYIKNLVDTKSYKIILIIDEAQNLKNDFLRNFPSFINYDYDAKDLLTVWFVGLSSLNNKLKQNDYVSLNTRIKVKCSLNANIDLNSFTSILKHELRNCGCDDSFFSNAGIDLLFIATKGNFRLLNNVISECLRISIQKKEQIISDQTIIDAIDALKS